MEKYLRDQLKDLIYKYAVKAYDDYYSSASYSEYMQSYKEMISVLISLAEKSGINISDIKAEYCGWCYSIEDFLNYENLTKYW